MTACVTLIGMQAPDYDLCIIGGGINGAGIARDAAGRGLRVVLLEAGDLASATSSASTKLIHGGLRYLEYFEFRLVRDSLKERETLLNIAPHIIWPMDFILPHDPAQRSFPVIRAGLFLYDHLAGRKKLRGSRGINFRMDERGLPLKSSYGKGFSYTDCWVDDSRLVVLNAVDAAAQGADIRMRTSCTGLRHQGSFWTVQAADAATGRVYDFSAAAVVNATGPWVRGLLESCGLADETIPDIRLVKGSHIIIPRAFEGDHAYILQQPDRRIVFAIPYEQEFTLIGTTEEDYTGDPASALISDAETAYLCDAFNRSFVQQISKDDLLWTYSGVRPLFDDGQNNATSVTRDYVLHHHKDFSAPLISVFGGKLTTYRVLAEKTLTKMADIQGRTTQGWTAGKALPGGDFAGGDFAAFLQQKTKEYAFLPSALVHRYARAYGTRMDVFLAGAATPEDLGRHYGDDVYEAEILYLVSREWARTAEDLLWRRSKLGLHISEETVGNITAALPDILKRSLQS